MANSSLDPRNPKEPYAIVQFDDIDEEGKLCIDLVLKKWFITRGNKNMCKYPPEAQYHLRDQFLEEFRTPEKLWPCVPYTFIVGAENVAQGHRRLQRAHFTKDCQTTDMEGEKSAKAPPLLSKSQISETLHDSLPMRSNSALQRKNTPTGTRSKSESRFSRINVIASDSDSEHEEHRSTYSSHLSPLRKSHNTDKAYQTKQSSSNSKKINASNPRKQLFKSIESKQSEDDSTLNVLTPNKRPTSMSQQLLTPSMKEKSKGELSTADNIEPFQDLKNYIEKKIENLRERIGYDLRIKINELKNTIIGADLTSAAGPNLTSTAPRASTAP
ncbi:uncharacterized protein [Temnothorax longispinosus]|uniref:uncharacterized protein isoform X2 n=1 Tax=Temnothorax longispinosus TaxID=300112 RepID=UPI003A9961FA